jgi:hypothetical protein
MFPYCCAGNPTSTRREKSASAITRAIHCIPLPEGSYRLGVCCCCPNAPHVWQLTSRLLPGSGSLYPPRAIC